MADVFALFGSLLAVGIALPGLLLSWQLLFPGLVERAEQRLTATPWRCLWLGLLGMAIYMVPVLILLSIPWGAIKAVGGLAIFVLATGASLGAAGLAAVMGRRLQTSGLQVSPAGATVRGAVALELAAIFPLVGWFIVTPLAFVITLGAAVFALLGWLPRPAPQPDTAQKAEEAAVPV